MVNFSFAKKYFKGLLFPVSVCYTLGIATQEIEMDKLTEHDNKVLRAIADGETRFQYLQDDGKWYAIDAAGALQLVRNHMINGTGLAVRIAHHTIRIGEVDVPAPMRVEPIKGQRYFFIEEQCVHGVWDDDEFDEERLAFGIWPTEAEATAVRDALRKLYQGSAA